LSVLLPDSELFPLLKRVSRSFYLSIRFLPSRIRPAIAIGYLLARASDTIADTNGFDPSYRLEILDDLKTSLAGTTDALARRIAPCVEAQPAGSERDLLERLIPLIAYIVRLTPGHQTLVVDVLNKIIRGQKLDIERFEMAGSLHALRNGDELEEYTYLVAGSVGEFWTKLCSLEWPSAYSRIPDSELERLGVEFGQGLQLVNILRDFPADLSRGRSYLPVPDLHGLKEDEELARPLFRQWHLRAAEYLRSAWGYVSAIRPTRVRFACALPALIGVQTLRKLDGPRVMSAKIGRSEVYWLMALALTVALVPRAAKPIGDAFGLGRDGGVKGKQ
jgi:farnesyl-diphosphate farnesyltransferase